MKTKRGPLTYPWWTGFRMRLACRLGSHRWADINPNVLATSSDGVTVCVFGVCTCCGQAMAVRRPTQEPKPYAPCLAGEFGRGVCFKPHGHEGGHTWS